MRRCRQQHEAWHKANGGFEDAFEDVRFAERSWQRVASLAASAGRVVTKAIDVAALTEALQARRLLAAEDAREPMVAEDEMVDQAADATGRARGRVRPLVATYSGYQITRCVEGKSEPVVGRCCRRRRPVIRHTRQRICHLASAQPVA
jgi:hypothetical protein